MPKEEKNDMFFVALIYNSPTLTMFVLELFKQIIFFKFQNATLEKTEVVIKNVQSRDTDNIGHTRHRTNKC